MTHRAVDALHVKARGGAVRTLHERGLTWVSFDPIPDLACDIDFGIRKSPDLRLLSGTVRGVRHVHPHRDSGDGNDDFSFHLNISGLSTVVSRRGATTLRGMATPPSACRRNRFTWLRALPARNHRCLSGGTATQCKGVPRIRNQCVCELCCGSQHL
jgi:hypothetical protein